MLLTAPAVVASLFLWCSGCSAQPEPGITAASPSVPDIQAAVDELEDGGVVRVPAGRCEAIGTVEVPGGVSLVGSGPGETILYRAGGTDANSGAPLLRVDGSNGRPSRIEGIGLIGMEDPESASWDTGLQLNETRDFRVTNCHFRRFGAAGIGTRGACAGVIDHCLFVDNFKRPINNVGYGVVVMGTGEWREGLVPGGAEAVFVEDCRFIGSRHAIASNAGASYVFRHNHVHGNDNSQAVDAHGPGYGSKHGTQWIEVYHNLIEKPVGGPTAMVFRGGGGVVFGNTIRDYGSAITLTLDFDSKIDWSAPYPIPEQIGNMWLWDNTWNDEPVQPQVPRRSAEHIKLDRDYFTRPLPGYEPFPYPHPLTAG